MPIYEYRCASCGTDFELTRPISQSGDPAPCPNCRRPAEKLVSSFASKADYAIKVPAKEPFRAPAAAAGAVKASARPTARGAVKAAVKAAAKPAARAAARVVAKAAAKPTAGRRASKTK